MQVYYIPPGCVAPKVKLEMTLESESAVLIDKADLADELEMGLSVANAIYIYEAINSTATVRVSDLFKVGP